MSDFYNLTKEQQAYLMHLAHKTFPSKFLSQQRARTIIHEEEEPDIYNDQELHGEYLPDDDSEGNQSYRSNEESEKDDDTDQEMQVSSLE